MRHTDKAKAGRVIGAIVAILVLLGLTAYTIYQCGGFTVDRRLTTDYASDITSDLVLTATGYVFRTERVIEAPPASVSDGLLADGERAAAGAALTKVYACTNEERASEIAGELAVIDARIAFLTECGSTAGLHLSDVDELRSALYDAYHNAMSAAGNGDAVTAAQAAEQMLIAMTKYGVLTGTSAGTESAVRALRAERSALLGGEATVLYAPESGYFYGKASVDGYESIRTVSALLDATGDGILDLIAAEPELSDAAGKLMTEFIWYLAVPVPEGDAETLKNDTQYTVTVTDGNGVRRQYPMTLTDARPTSDGKRVLIFSCMRDASELMSVRSAAVSLVTGTVSGYRVPDAAVTESDGVTGVYILDGTTVCFRRITVLEIHDGYLIVAARDPEAENYREFLNRGDRLILDGKDLYDGKQYD